MSTVWSYCQWCFCASNVGETLGLAERQTPARKLIFVLAIVSYNLSRSKNVLSTSSKDFLQDILNVPKISKTGEKMSN